MTFLGKIALEYDGRRMAVAPDGTLKLLALAPNDPAGIFLATESGRFQLQSHIGYWVYFQAGKAPDAWYTVLYSARVNRTFSNYFSMAYYDRAARKVKLGWTTQDNVAVVLTHEQNLSGYCMCEWDVVTNAQYSTQFELRQVAPGADEVQAGKNGAGVDWGWLGSAPVDLRGAAFSGVNFREANFSGAELGGVVFEDCDLSSATFTGAKAASAVFRRCTMVAAEFREAELSGAVFDGCTVEQSWFQGTRLAGADFRTSPLEWVVFAETDLTETLLPQPVGVPGAITYILDARIRAEALGKDWSWLNLTGTTIEGLETADLEGLALYGTTVPGIDLSGKTLGAVNAAWAVLNGARFQDARLEGARFLSAELRDAYFSGARLQGAVFEHATDFEDTLATDLTGARFSQADLSGASLRGSLLARAVLSAANLAGADLTGAQLGGVEGSAAANLSYAYMGNAKLDRANLFGVSFAYATLFGASASVTETATMELADFSNAYLAGIDLTGADLRGARLAGACLVNVRLTNAVLTPAALGTVVASLAGATLQGADFTGAQLDRADLTNAAVAFADGQISVRYCDELKTPFPPPPDAMPLRHGPTVGLDLSTMGPETQCPNGFTVAENEAAGRTLQEMLTSPTAPTSWYATQCGPGAEAMEE